MMDLAPLLGPQGMDGSTVVFRLFPRRGSERWLLETRYRQPWHLETWPQANLRAKMIYRFARFLGIFGVQLPSRRVTLTVAEGSIYQGLRNRFDALGIFLGTPGPNRKVVIFARENDAAWFIKVPLNAATRSLAHTEAATLNALKKEEGLAPLVPRCTWIGDALAIEDVRENGARFAPLDSTEILRVHDLLFTRSCSRVPLSDLAQQWQAGKPSRAPHASLAKVTQIASARHAARTFLHALPPNTPVDCYDAHGDFTRWNVLRAADGKARVIDWELFGQRPKFFDPFHYLVSQAILVDRASADKILEQARRMAAETLDHDSITLYLGAYVSYQVFYYSDIFSRQDVLHAQAHWQLDIWTKLLEKLVTFLSRSNRIGDSQ